MLTVSKNILCVANTQHNCAHHGCKATGQQAVTQERVQTSKTISVIEHIGKLDDVFLNLFQMRNAAQLTPFRPILPEMNTESIMLSSATNEWHNRLAASQRAKEGEGGEIQDGLAASRGQGRGRGRGRGRAARGCGGGLEAGTPTSPIASAVSLPAVLGRGHGSRGRA